MANKRELKCLMTKQEKNLIMNSSICVQMPNLKEFLLQFNNCIYQKDLDKIRGIDEEVYRIIMTRDAVVYLKDAASKEWYHSEHLGIINEACQLCGSKKSEDKFLISNRIIDNKLRVGTSCIFKFEKLENTLKGISIKEYARLAKDNPDVINRIVRFTEIYPRGRMLFFDWKNKYESYDIIFPKKFDDEFYLILKKADKLYYNYTRKKIEEKDVKQIDFLQVDFNYLINKCEKYYFEHKGNKYRCTKNIANWIKAKNYNSTLDHIREKGLIEKDFAKYISCIDFVSRFEDEIKSAFGKLKFKLEGINDSYLEFSYVFRTFVPIFLVIPISKFTSVFYEIFYGKTNYSADKLLNTITVKNDYQNIYEYLGILNILIKDKKYYFKIRRDENNLPVIELFEKGTYKIANIKINKILNNYANALYLSEEKAKDYIMDLISKETWTNRKEDNKFDFGDIRKVWQTDWNVE